MTAQLAAATEYPTRAREDSDAWHLAIVGDIEHELRAVGQVVPELSHISVRSAGEGKEAVLLPLADAAGNCLLLPSLRELVTIVVTRVEEAKREMQHRLQAEGIAAAKARGVRFGRAPLTPGKSFLKAYELWQAGKITTTEAARLCGMRRSTFHMRAKSVEKRQAVTDNDVQVVQA